MSGHVVDHVYLTRAYRTLRSELDVLLDHPDFWETYKGLAPKLSHVLEAMDKIARVATVEITPEIQDIEDGLLKEPWRQDAAVS